MSRDFGIALCLLAAGVLPPPLVAQWSVGLDVGASHFTGASLDTSTGGTVSSFHPQHPTVVGLHVDRSSGRAGVGLGLLYASAGLVGENSDVAVAQKGVFTLLELAPEAWLCLARTGAGTDFRLHLGPLLDVWSEEGTSGRTRAGAHAALSATWPVVGRVTGSARAALALTGSVFNAGQLPPEFAHRAMWRRSAAIGLRYRL